jgi:hypothetical protein
MTPQGEAPVQQPGWFSRNWKWAVPVGCGLPLLCCVSFTVVTLLGVSTAMKSSEAYVEGMKRATSSADVKAALGEPITVGLMVSGNINDTGGGDGHATLALPLTGPKGKGTLYVDADKAAGAWTYARIEVVVDGGRRVNLLGGSAAEPHHHQHEPSDEQDDPPPDKGKGP